MLCSAAKKSIKKKHTTFLSLILLNQLFIKSFPGGSVVKNLTANAGDRGSVPGLGRSTEEGNGNPRQYSCLENPMDRGDWRATVHRVAKSWTRLSYFPYRNKITLSTQSTQNGPLDFKTQNHRFVLH